MNYFIRIALIFIAIMLAPPTFAFGKVKHSSDVNPPQEQEVIHLDVSKNDSEGKQSIPRENFKNQENNNATSSDWIQKDIIRDNVDTEFSIFDNLIDTDKDSDHPFKIEEESLFGRIYKKKLERTSIPSFLLKDELTFKYKKGIIDKVQFYGAYQGDMGFDFSGSDYDTDYGFGFMEAGVIGDFKDKNTDFKLQFNFKKGENRTYLQGLVTDAYIMNTRIPHHKIIIGNSRNQVGFEGGMGSYVLPFAMRSQISRTFGNTRALGVRVVGDYDLVDYSVALNSSDRFFKEFFPGAEFTGWVNFKPLGKTDGKYGTLVLGGGLNAGHNDTNYTVGGAYASYRYKKFMTNFEYAIADGYNGTYISTDKATGFYTTIQYRLTQKLHILARYDQFDPNRDVANNLRREYSAGINYFIKGQALRLILNYVFCDNEDTEDSHRIILGTQILL